MHFTYSVVGASLINMQSLSNERSLVVRWRELWKRMVVIALIASPPHGYLAAVCQWVYVPLCFDIGLLVLFLNERFPSNAFVWCGKPNFKEAQCIATHSNARGLTEVLNKLR